MASKPDTTAVPLDPAAPAGAAHCPYCAESIRPEAIVCKHCGRDLFFLSSILLRLSALETSLSARADASHATLAQRLDQLDAIVSGMQAASATQSQRILPQPDAVPQWLTGSAALRCSVTVVCAGVLALVAVFMLLHWVFDVDEVFLRLVSILIPVPFGFIHAARCRFGYGRECTMGLLFACLFIACVTRIVAELQGQPWAPQDLREWREVITYGSSILFAYVTGAVAAKIMAERSGLRGSGLLAAEVARWLLALSSRADASGERIKHLATAVQAVTSSLLVLCTSVAAIWTGIGKLFS